MESYAARLASFNVAHPHTKKRASNARGAKTLKWPHESPPVPQLARAGLFYQPTSSCPDNTICYLCQSSIDGWEEGDDPVVEHLRLSPNCGWAITVAIEQDVENGSYSLEDPMCEKVLNARRMTFGSSWPHEDKRGWTCKVQKMIEAGWHYCPTPESDDYVKCSYCNLGLDGWEPKDKPFEEHQRRSPDCSFFTLYASIKTKPGRSKTSRASKASRLSTQSNVTAVSEAPSVTEIETNGNDTMMSIAESEKPSKPTRGKKSTTNKKTIRKGKGKGAKIQQNESQIASSFVEPEDDDFEVKVDPSPAPAINTKKRKSEELSTSNDDPNEEHGSVEDTQPQVPAKRQRRTKASTNAPPSQDAPAAVLSSDVEVDAAMTDKENMPPPAGPTSKKKAKTGKKRASSTTRKASNASNASKAPLRANVPIDAEIDAVLEADLDRPLTDDEGDAEPVNVEQPKGRRLTRNKPGSTKAIASVASTRKGTRASSIRIIASSAENLHSSTPVVSTKAQEPEEGEKRIEARTDVTSEPLQVMKVPTIEVSRKDQVHQPVQGAPVQASQQTNAGMDGDTESEKKKGTKGRQTRKKKASEQLSDNNQRSSNASNASNTQLTIDLPTDINSSVLDTQTAQDDSGHETDASVVKQSQTKRKGRKAPAPVRAAKRGKKAPPINQNAKENVQPTVSVETGDGDETVSHVAPSHADSAESDHNGREPLKKLAEKSAEVPKSEESTESMPNQEIFSAVRKSSDADMEVEYAVSQSLPSRHSTPRPALSSQSSDAENQPPSARPSSSRPPLSVNSPSEPQITRVPLAITPVASPSKGGFSRLQSAFPWTAVDLENIFQGTPSTDKENNPFVFGGTIKERNYTLSSPEKKLTVEEWIQHNAQRGEEQLRNECERLVGRFEGEGVRALKTLEGIVCSQ
ncbi:hypothetical protein ACLMJK_007456 [Lecanora helva]